MKHTFGRSPSRHLAHFAALLDNGLPFSFVRFSDGETEILRNRELRISGNHVIFRNTSAGNPYPDYDNKVFDPSEHSQIRSELLDAARFRDDRYFKGIPTRHNQCPEDTALMVKLNGNSTDNLTFADLFTNNNFLRFRRVLLPRLTRSLKLYVVANFRCTPLGPIQHAVHVPVKDNVFSDFENSLNSVLSILNTIPPGALVLSSASTLTKVLGFRLRRDRPDVTFLDIGTSINDILGLDLTRTYLKVYATALGHEPELPLVHRLRIRASRGFRLAW